MLLGLLPFIGLVLTIISLKKTLTLYNALAVGSVIWGIFIYISTTILSFLGSINYICVLIFWCVYCAVFVYRAKMHLCFSSISIYKEKNYYLITLAIIAFLTLVTGLLYPPNTWDSMTYHMPKVMHWIQNQSQEHYFTHIIRQNGMAPFSETIILHTVILAKSDIFANLVQWSAFIGSLFMIASITNQLGGSKKACLFASTFFATLPMAILQASSTQTDVVVTFWILVFISSLLKWKEQTTYFHAICAACSLGLAIYTKGTTYVITLPFVVYFAYLIFKDLRTRILQGLVMSIIIISINAPHLLRNYEYYGDIFASTSETMAERSPQAFIINVSGNILANVDPIGAFVARVIYREISSAIGVSTDNTKIFPYGLSIRPRRGHEDVAPNMLHTCLLIFMFIFFFKNMKKFPRTFMFLTLASLASFCVFISFQPWITRLQVPLFALCSSSFGLFLSTIQYKTKYVKEALMGALIVYMLIPLTANQLRPLFSAKAYNASREELYFSNRPDRLEKYVGALDALSKRNPHRIGIYSGGDSWEYPLWPMLEQRLQYKPQLQHLTDKDIQNGTFPYIITLDRVLHEKLELKAIDIFEKTNEGYRSILK